MTKKVGRNPQLRAVIGRLYRIIFIDVTQAKIIS